MTADEHKTKIVWREWFNEAAVAALTKMKTLPRNESMIDTRWMDGEEIAAEIAKEENEQDGEAFRESGEIVILEPTEFAGTYDVSVEYEPVFSASLRPPGHE